jgi:hypothetical protein
LRQKLKPGGRWFAFREWYADTPQELAANLANHPFCQPFRLYEWPYPAAHYAKAIELAGFRLSAVLPIDYANNCMGSYAEGEPSAENVILTKQIDALLESDPQATVAEFWREELENQSLDAPKRRYTRPQMFMFVKRPV